MSRCIFISYSTLDADQAAELESILRAEGFEVWRDNRNVEQDWSVEIATALAERADAICLLWSANAAQSHWVLNEWLTARAIEKLIVPWRLAAFMASQATSGDVVESAQKIPPV